MTAATGVERLAAARCLPGRATSRCTSPGILALILGEQDVAASVERHRARGHLPALTSDVVVRLRDHRHYRGLACGRRRQLLQRGRRVLVPWVEAALGPACMSLDLQPGCTDFTQAKLYESLLCTRTWVSRSTRSGGSGRTRCTCARSAPCVDRSTRSPTRDLARTQQLPQKPLVLHQFMQRMIVGHEPSIPPTLRSRCSSRRPGQPGGKVDGANLHENAPGRVVGVEELHRRGLPMATRADVPGAADAALRQFASAVSRG